MKRLWGLVAAAVLAAAPAAQAQNDGKTVKIGVLSDMSGPYADVVGNGSVAAAKLAVEDAGGQVLGMPIEVVSADMQNKPDLASSIARQWFDTENVDVLAGGGASSSALAMQEVAREKKHIYLITDAASSDFTGKACSPFGIHFTYDTYALANGTAKAMIQQGGDTWFFITVDYAFGHAMEADATRFVEAAGGKVLGAVRHPLGAADLSSFLLQAQASHAKVIGLANASSDTANTIKQAAEFGIAQGGQKLAALLMMIRDVESIGLPTAQGLTLTESFYWDLDDKTRAFTKRFMADYNDKVPTMTQAGMYSAVNHYLKAVKAAGTKDPETVVAKMKELPVDDMYNDNVQIRADGRVLVRMYLEQVKSPAESKYPHDDYKILASTPGNEAFRPLAEDNCPLLKAR
ncbi:MAG: ABC transporter substrate-binding protein [Alphaproteobacteria bacterium]|nr:ABC transporter substrate-binding protein [Alphaproteobacteria bacterium]MBV9860799.1 ABC transporter substrate-binding protein [Alphaproteobacteria bacterium]